MGNKKLEELNEKIAEIDEMDRKKQIGKEEVLNRATHGLQILYDIIKIPQIKEYAKRRDIYIDFHEARIIGHIIFIRYTKDIPHGSVDNCNVYYAQLTDRICDPKLLVINDWYANNSISDKTDVVLALSRINGIGKDKTLERILNNLLE